MKLLLSKKERKLISQIVTDQQSGNHLLRERTPEYWKMYRRLQMVNSKYWKMYRRLQMVNSKADNIRTEYECQMFEYADACEDYYKYRAFCEKYCINEDLDNTIK